MLPCMQTCFRLAFGLVPADQRPQVARWLVSRGMAGSVYAAQYLLEGLFENDEAAAALALITAPGDRSWRHMVDSGATITWEAWDQKYKPNQDWNHAWGAAPANLLPRFVLGAQPLTPGWARALIQPHPGTLTHADGRLPTPRGELAVSWKQDKNFTLILSSAPWGDRQSRVAGTQRFKPSAGRWRFGEGASRRSVVDPRKGSLGICHDRGAIRRQMIAPYSRAEQVPAAPENSV